METYIETKKIDFECKEIIENVRSKNGHILSSHAFTSLYLWQGVMNLSMFVDDDFFAVRCFAPKANSWFFPCGNEQKIYNFLNKQISDKNFSLHYLRDCDVSWLEEKFPRIWNFRHDENSDEYIDDVEKYMNMQGSEFSGIRKKIRKIDKNYDIRACEITKETQRDAMFVIRSWYEQQHHIAENGIFDDRVAEIALHEREKLGVSGIVLYANNKPVSIFAGFELTKDTVDLLIVKSTLDAPAGFIYYGMLEYFKFLGGKYRYCNNEEDLGIEGIRQIKTNFCPITKTKIWEATLK